MIDELQKTPFVGIVATNRQKKKAEKGTEVEVRVIKEGDWGFYAMAYKAGESTPVFLSLSNIDFVRDVSDERRATLEAETKAWKAEGDAPVFLGTDPDWEGDRSVAFDFKMTDKIKNNISRERLFIPKQKKNGDPIFDKVAGTIPTWLGNLKVKEICGEHSLRYELTERWNGGNPVKTEAA